MRLGFTVLPEFHPQTSWAGPADRVPPNCHQQLSTDIKNWHWHKDRELVRLYVVPKLCERDDEIFNGSHGHGVASFGQRYKSSGSRDGYGLANTKKHHGATSWCHLLPCWAHEKTSFILVPGEVPKSLSAESFPSGTALVAVLQDHRGKDLSQQPIRRCAGGWR